METFAKPDAVELIKAALQSKAITLTGNHTGASLENAKAAAERDGAYLLTLLNSLTKKPAA